MAYTERLSRQDRVKAAAAIARRAPDLAAEGAALAESFAIWQLPSLKTVRDGGKLGDHLIATGTWHHQVPRAEGPPASLLAWHREETGPLAAGVFDADPLAQNIESAIAWADEHLDDDWEARLVFVPELLAHFFLFTKAGQELLFPVSFPGEASFEGGPVAAETILAVRVPSSWPADGSE